MTLSSSAANMAGYGGKTVARIAQNGSGYGKGSMIKKAMIPMMPLLALDKGGSKHISPPNLRSLRTQTTNRVHNYRLGNNPITQDTQLSNLI